MKAFKTYLALLFLGILLPSLSSFSLNDGNINDDGYIRWNERKLAWSDFQGKVPHDTKFHASTQSAINLDYETNGSVITFKIESIFDPANSWKKNNVNTYILEHEQTHFDITEYHTRLLRKEIQQIKFSSFASVDREMKELYNKIHDSATEMQCKYDQQTEHSLEKKKQAKWTKKMERLLEQTKAYHSTEIKVDISYLIN